MDENLITISELEQATREQNIKAAKSALKTVVLFAAVALVGKVVWEAVKEATS